jgi:hypothetical protein
MIAYRLAVLHVSAVKFPVMSAVGRYSLSVFMWTGLERGYTGWRKDLLSRPFCFQTSGVKELLQHPV